jgi:hypothetical protein
VLFTQTGSRAGPQLSGNAAAPHAHAPAEHVERFAHAWPQAPQFAESVWTLTQGGLAPVVRQSVVGAWHWQSPAEQVAPRTPGPAHAWPHAPQSDGSVDRSTHAPGEGPQVAAADDGQTQAPAAHVAPVGQRWPHAPQWAGSSERRSTHRASQQLAPAAQTFPQAPQLAASLPAATQRSPQRTLGLVQDSFDGQPARSAAAPTARTRARARGGVRFTGAMMDHARATVHRDGERDGARPRSGPPLAAEHPARPC